MKDILKFGQYVRQIAEAQSRGDTKREKRLAQKGEEWFDIYGVPDYSAETGETVGELPFFEDLKAAERTGKDGKKILFSNLQDARSIKEQAEEYLTATEGTRAPGRCYIRRCLNAVEGIIEYLEKVQQVSRFAAFPIDQGEVAGVEPFQAVESAEMNEEHRKPEIVCFDLPPQEEKRDSLFRQTEVRTDIRFIDFKDYITQLTQNGILCQGEKDSVRKLQAGFKSFLMGATNKEDISEFGSKDYLLVGDTKKFVLLIDKLQFKVKADMRKNNLWSITRKWFVYRKGGKTKKFGKNSLRTICSKAKAQLVSNDRSIDDLVTQLLNIIYKNV